MVRSPTLKTLEYPVNALTPDDLSRSIADIYDCAVEPAHWTGTLTRLNARLNGAYTGFALSDPSANLPRMAAFSPWDPEMLRRLSVEFSPADVPALAAVMANDVDVGATQLGTMDEASFQATAFFQDWVAPQGLRDAYCVTFVRAPARFGLLTFTTRADRDAILPEESAFMSLLSPHVRRAVMIGDLLDEPTLSARIFRSALDHLSVPVVLTDAASRILYANERAETLLSLGAPIRRDRHGRLAPANPAMAAGLADAVARTAGDAASDLGARGIGLPVSAPGAAGAIAYVLPLNRGAALTNQSEAAAAVFVATTHATLPPKDEVVASLYGLSRAEARVFLEIGQGRSIAEAAAALGISQNTVKSQLNRVYAGAGVHRQSDLARLLLGLSQPVQ
jgi:DNA-binding CsgD family transcriptional regulator/PAS domain-containing protein